MGGGAMWRSVARAVGAAAPTVAATNAAFCSACTASPSSSQRSPASSPSARVASCSCAVQQHPGSSVSFGPRQYWDLDDWEFAGDEERDHYVFGSLPTVKEVEEASTDLQNALRLGFLGPPVAKVESYPSVAPTIVEVTEVTEVSTVTTVGDVDGEINSDLSAPPTEPEWTEPPSLQVATSPRQQDAPSSAMLEAFHQFQHNPQVQGMVVSLATDKGVWEAVLANQKIQEFRQNFSELEASPEDVETQRKKSSQSTSNVFSQFFWSTKKAFTNFIQSFQDFMTSLFETADKKDLGNEKVNLFERSIKACMMLAVVVLAIVVFKRAAVVKRG